MYCLCYFYYLFKLFATFLGLFLNSFYGVTAHSVLLGDQCPQVVIVLSVGCLVYKGVWANAFFIKWHLCKFEDPGFPTNYYTVVRLSVLFFSLSVSLMLRLISVLDVRHNAEDMTVISRFMSSFSRPEWSYPFEVLPM